MYRLTLAAILPADLPSDLLLGESGDSLQKNVEIIFKDFVLKITVNSY